MAEPSARVNRVGSPGNPATVCSPMETIGPSKGATRGSAMSREMMREFRFSELRTATGSWSWASRAWEAPTPVGLMRSALRAVAWSCPLNVACAAEPVIARKDSGAPVENAFPRPALALGTAAFRVSQALGMTTGFPRSSSLVPRLDSAGAGGGAAPRDAGERSEGPSPTLHRLERWSTARDFRRVPASKTRCTQE